MEPRGSVLQSHSRALDGIRAFAVLAVIASHLAVPGARGGGFGVLVFFVLSGFLITTLLTQERDRTGRIRLGLFYMRRALRLLPALAAVIVATTLAAYTLLEGPAGDASVRSIPAALFYFANWVWFFEGTGIDTLGYFGHFWSLSVEEQFYLIWPPVLILLWRRFGEATVVLLLAGICVISLGIRLATIHGPETGHLLFGTHAIADQLAWGALLALLMRRRGPAVERVVHAAAWPAGALLAGLVAIVRPEDPGALGVFSNTLAPTLAAIASAVIIGHVVTRREEPMSRLLSWAPLVYLGKISYGLYLWHVVVLSVVVRRWGGDAGGDLLALAGTLLVATGSFYLWEKSFLRLKDRFEPDGSPAGADLSGQVDK